MPVLSAEDAPRLHGGRTGAYGVAPRFAVLPKEDWASDAFSGTLAHLYWVPELDKASGHRLKDLITAKGCRARSGGRDGARDVSHDADEATHPGRRSDVPRVAAPMLRRQCARMPATRRPRGSSTG